MNVNEVKPFSNSIKNKSHFIKKLAYLGLKQFVIGLTNDLFRDRYKNILMGDHKLFVTKVFNGTLNTVSSSLIQGTIDFLSEKLKKNISLIINKIPMLSNTNHIFDDHLTKPIKLKISNKRNHFFIHEFNDTLGDGYCFFHAIAFLLDRMIPQWKTIVMQDLQTDQILTKNDIVNKLNQLL